MREEKREIFAMEVSPMHIGPQCSIVVGVALGQDLKDVTGLDTGCLHRENSRAERSF